jgi:hypothetical protein
MVDDRHMGSILARRNRRSGDFAARRQHLVNHGSQRPVNHAAVKLWK